MSRDRLSVGLVNLGCARNLVDSEVAVGTLLRHGYAYVEDVESADIALVNTCGFIDEAKRESVQSIVELLELKKRGRIRAVVVMGCLSQRYGQALAKELQGIDAVVGTNEFEKLAAILDRLPEKIVHIERKPDYVLNRYSPRFSLTPDYMAYIKISEGCINRCAYCAIPLMKGPHRSRPVEDIVGQVTDLVESSPIREINLIGQDIAAYGYDIGRKFLLSRLVSEVARSAPEAWIRLLYAHPAHVTDDLTRVFKDHPNIARYIDLPIEHSHPDVLQRMRRGSTRKEIDHIIRTFRKEVPRIAIRTTVIVGLPGETEEEFQDLLAYIRETRFERLGAFRYSREEGTPAASMEPQIPEEVKRERFDRVMTAQRKILEEQHDAKIGHVVKVLIEKAQGTSPGVYLGRTEHDAPEVDTQVLVHASTPHKPGTFVSCRITDRKGYDLVGLDQDG